MEIEFPVADGVLSGADFGGYGEGVVLVRGSGHDSAAWVDVASHLVGHCHPVALDLRGYGQTELSSSGPEQYWRDIGSVVAALPWDRPVLAGHSTGGYAVTAAAASGLAEPAALCVVDGVVLDDRDTSLAGHAAVRTPEAADRLRNMFRYGWKAGDEQMHACIGQCVPEAERTGSTPERGPGLPGRSCGAASSARVPGGCVARSSRRSLPSVPSSPVRRSFRAPTSMTVSPLR